MNGRRSLDELLWAMDQVIGQEVDNLLYMNGYDFVGDDEFYRLLAFLYRRLKRTWFGARKNIAYEDFIKRLRYYHSRKRTLLRNVLSYLISEYFETKTSSIRKRVN